MKTSYAAIVSTLCVAAYSFNPQQVLGSVDVLRTSYECNNSGTPTIECTDSSTPPTCACACSNGITFN
ncbi:hypothetical protein COCC4DRAFT_142464 [Bipolaris maydis ATCC 48331]|uniref:Uncharacterized protein n=1 Tax=Cochliobolus heterostrophus (strain C4 / ATCC 48331 / race T) TaxID=665024 RepID=N4XEM3_COCH4|nr:uncharacterized protein COCC4DRAFT_142464 [Bipolaris maydis ATCC 48331]ENI03582.1 hypothetical protein COCC4DRAFT_142464 [Bipolaris maydis ATCC 48331]